MYGLATIALKAVMSKMVLNTYGITCVKGDETNKFSEHFTVNGDGF